jgi:hypothetical protein
MMQVHLTSKLSEPNLNGSLMSHLTKLQSDANAGIRTNATILMGKIAGQRHVHL